MRSRKLPPNKRHRLAATLPASIEQRAFHHIHAPHHRAHRNAEMRNLFSNTVRSGAQSPTHEDYSYRIGSGHEEME